MRYSYHLAVERELRRIGVDQERLSALAVGGPDAPSADDVLAWLRGVRAGIGHEAFEQLWETAGPTAGLAFGGLPPADPAFVYPDLDLRQAFHDELERVLPPDMRPPNWLIADIDLATHLPALRKLPDRAGWDAVAAILPLGKVIEPEGP